MTKATTYLILSVAPLILIGIVIGCGFQFAGLAGGFGGPDDVKPVGTDAARLKWNIMMAPVYIGLLSMSAWAFIKLSRRSKSNESG